MRFTTLIKIISSFIANEYLDNCKCKKSWQVLAQLTGFCKSELVKHLAARE